MGRMPNGERAIVDLRKLEDYCLSPSHIRGRHKARVFMQALGLDRSDASWLRQAPLEAARTNQATEPEAGFWKPLANRCEADQIGKDGRGTLALDHPSRGGGSPIRHRMGAVMGEYERERARRLSLLDPVALLAEHSASGLAPG
jgi:hypothetical protein